MQLEIWIASHFHSQQRFEWFRETVKSLESQTLKVKIYMSWSKEDYVRIDMAVFSNIIHFYQPYRLTQFEHFEYILTHRDITDNTFVGFCDDDDMYHPNRVQFISDYIQNHPGNVFRDMAFVIDGLTTFDDLLKTTYDTMGRGDFPSHVVNLHVIETFFSTALNRSSPVAQSGYVDVVFIAWLKNVQEIPEYLYYYRQDHAIPMAHCHDKSKDFDFEKVKDEEKLDVIFY